MFSARSKRRYARSRGTALAPEVRRGILVIILFAISLFSILSFFEATGSVGEGIVTFLGRAFGWVDFVPPLFVLIMSLYIMRGDERVGRGIYYLGLVFIIVGAAGLAHLPMRELPLRDILDQNGGGGVIGYAIGGSLYRFMAAPGAGLALTALTLIGLIIFFAITPRRLAALFSAPTNLMRAAADTMRPTTNRGKKGSEDYVVNFHTEKIAPTEPRVAAVAEEPVDEDEGADDAALETDAGERTEKLAAVTKPRPPRKTFPPINLPLNLLTSTTEIPASGDIKASVKKIESTLKSFGIDVTMGDVNVGPTVTQYTLKPFEGVKLNQITALNSDLALALAAHPIRIEAPIPGKSLVGIEVPNEAVSVVKLKEILESATWQARKNNLAIALGKDVTGKAIIADLPKLPHLLIAGATGSGKSVAINSILVSLLYQNSPDLLKLILIDPKRVELSSYDSIPHLITPVITDVEKTIHALRWTVAQMDERYKLLSAAGKKNIQSYNDARLVDKMPYIVVIVDELADLMMVAAKEVESAIIRLAQMARAVGIHLILATQRPSVNVITGLIKANITSRIAFAVASSTDSRTIIDTSGAEKLLGNGDMLYISAELSKPKRIQGAFITDVEISGVTDYLKSHGEPEYEEGVTERRTSGSSVTPGSYEEVAEERDVRAAAEVVIKAKRASATLLQSRMRVGFAKASRLLDVLEERGIIGPQLSSKPREVLLTEEELNAQFQGGDAVPVRNDPVEDESEDQTDPSFDEISDDSTSDADVDMDDAAREDDEERQ